ncbi:hypothetical protein PV433_31120 [Paenibacillus sp. GYB004]|uniref:hypothetical protein n=1 Tax=Paenibacillus sp. GYB004 TaxID=2994393 RepID=UPI002F96D1CA
MEKQTVYRIRYTADNRVKAVHASQEPQKDEKHETIGAWFVLVLGALACVGWWSLWG